MVEVIIILDT